MYTPILQRNKALTRINNYRIVIIKKDRPLGKRRPLILKKN
jgi:hypothetical protein